MNKILFSTTALSAVSALAMSSSVASAAEKKKEPQPIKIGVSGSMHSMAGFGNNDGSFEADSAADVSRETYDSFNMVQDSEIHFTGSTTLENGIALSVAIQLEADQVNKAAASIDASYMKMTGTFGDIRIGSHAGVAAIMRHKGPANGPIGLDTGETNSYVVRPSAHNIATAAGTTIGGSDAIKLIYITPRVGASKDKDGKAVPGTGLFAGFAYTPSKANDDNPPDVGGNTGSDVQVYQSIVSYEDTIGSTAVKADIAYWEEHGQAAGSHKAIAGGVNLTMGGLTVGFGVKGQSNIDSGVGGTDTSNDQNNWQGGFQYAVGDYTVGANYLSGEEDAAGGKSTVEKWALGGSYNIGQGVSTSAGLYHVEWDDSTTVNAANNSGWALVAGIKVKF